MSFSLICLIGIIVAAPFGLAFTLAPEQTAAFYGITGSPGAMFVARLFGIELLSIAGAFFAVRQSTDLGLQRRFALAFSLFSRWALPRQRRPIRAPSRACGTTTFRRSTRCTPRASRARV